MLRVLRRCRALALTLLLAAPGLGGTWLSLAHPCPVDMPWLAGAEHDGHGAQAPHGHGDAGDSSSGSCSCVGACQGGAAALIQSQAHAATTLAATGWDNSPTAAETDAPVESRSHRHPPATAPPLA
jgi:hypothetical protein